MTFTFTSLISKCISVDSLNQLPRRSTAVLPPRRTIRTDKHRFRPKCGSFGCRSTSAGPAATDVSSVVTSEQSVQDELNKISPTTVKKISIPKPTWSISSLQLHEKHTPASMEELQVLAKRSVLDVRRMSDETKQQLCQDLGNMLHMMKQVQNFQDATDNNEIDPDPVALYDAPRGVSEIPFRMDDNDGSHGPGITTTIDHDDESEVRMSKSVRESYLAPKMKRVGGHQYYEIITSISHTTKETAK